VSTTFSPGSHFPDRLLLLIPPAGILVGWAWNQYGLAGALGALHVIALVEALRKRLLRYLGRRDLQAHVQHIALPEWSPYLRASAVPTPASVPNAWRQRPSLWQPHTSRFRT
jgi:hypothetical protein